MGGGRIISGLLRKPIALVALLALMGLLGLPAAVKGSPALEAANFTQAAPQGFGDRQNSWAWAMQWWRGHLYVGTSRAQLCATQASLYLAFPNVYPYPPSDPDVSCSPDPHDLPLQAEIWRWTPPNLWERVFQAPNIPIPGSPGKFVGRDVAYRGMTVFTEADGTEALYVGGVSPRLIYDGPPPRILRSTDGLHFEALPQDPGTFLGDLPWASLRNLTSYNGRFYIEAGTSQGAGALLEADDPRGGNNNFHDVTPAGRTISAVLPFNGFLYVGTEDLRNGYAVLKTDASGTPPYTFTSVIEKGGYNPSPNVEILSMKVFQGRLYLGANGITTLRSSVPAELVRVNPDDSWDVVVGDPRLTPTGVKNPISGLYGGFGNQYNNHMWRMEVFDGSLYVGTFDSSTALKDDPNTPQSVRAQMGFDLYRTPDGIQFAPITTTGFTTASFDGKFDFGVRNMAATPYGLFLGTANYYYGLNIYRGVSPGFRGFRLYIPMAQTSSTSPIRQTEPR